MLLLSLRRYLSLLLVALLLHKSQQALELEDGSDAQSIEPEEGDQVMLQCNEQGASAADKKYEWFWQKDLDKGDQQGKMILNKKMRVVHRNVRHRQIEVIHLTYGLRIPEANRLDTGIYTCKVTNEDKSTQEAKYTMQVKHPPDPPVTIFPDHYTFGEQEKEFTFTCTATGYPAVNYYTWFKKHEKTFLELPDDTTTVTSAHVFVDQNLFQNHDTGDLTFRKASEGNIGHYFCRASNSIGKTDSAPQYVAFGKYSPVDSWTTSWSIVLGAFTGAILLVIMVVICCLECVCGKRDFADQEYHNSMSDEGDTAAADQEEETEEDL